MLKWIKFSNPSGNCPEMAELPNGEIAWRNSRHPRGPVLIFNRTEMGALVQHAKDGHLDELVS
jgi:hypothetical protein